MDPREPLLVTHTPYSSPVVLNQKEMQCCHVIVPDTAKPVSAILFQGQFYSYVKFYAALEAAQRGAERLLGRGDAVVLTHVPKGFVLWALEPDAQLVIRR